MKNFQRGEGTPSHSKKTNTNKKRHNRDYIDFIKEQISPLDFYEQELSFATLIMPKWNDGGLCPFHQDKKPGSFFVNLETGAFKCHSCEVGGGDIIAFTMEVYGLTFPEALARLAEDWGLSW